MSDPIHGHYRTKEEIEDQKKRDPIHTFRARLHDEGLFDDDEFEVMDQEIQRELDDAVLFADESADPELQELYTDVYWG